MSRYRRRKKRSLWSTLPLWAAGLSLVGWGLYQAAEFRQKLITDFQKSQALARAEEELGQPSVAVEGLSISRREALRTGVQAYHAPTPANLTSMSNTPEGYASIVILDPAREPADAPRRTPRVFPNTAPPLFEATLTPADLIARAQAAFDAGRIPEGRAALNAALARSADEAEAQALREALAALNVGVFLGSDILPDDPLACYIEIEPGDSFLRLGRDFALTPTYLEAINPSLNSRNLKPLTGMKVVQGPFRVKVVKRASRMDLYLADMYIRSYAIQLPEGNFLPKGDYRVSAGNKIQVGQRLWIGFQGADESTQPVESGWIYGSWGPRGTSSRNRATGLILGDADVLQLYNVLVETRSQLHVEP